MVGSVRIVLLGVLVVAAIVMASAGAPRPVAGDESIVDVEVVQLVDYSRPTPAIGDYGGAPACDLQPAVWLPATTDPAPLILLAHGFNGHPRKFTDLARRWAEAGYVVAVPRFPVTNDEFSESDPAFVNARIADLAAQADDVVFVIEKLRATARTGRTRSPDASIPTVSDCTGCRSGR